MGGFDYFTSSFSRISEPFIEFYEALAGKLPFDLGSFILLVYFTIIAINYVFYITHYHKFLSKKNFLGLDLYKNELVDHPFFSKLFSIIFYIIEYLLVLPIVTIIWFYFFASFLFVLTDLGVINTLAVSALMVATARVLAFVDENKSAHFTQVTAIAFFVMFFIGPIHTDSYGSFIERLLQLPFLYNYILYFLIFIISVELFLKIDDIFGFFFGWLIEKEKKKKKNRIQNIKNLLKGKVEKKIEKKVEKKIEKKIENEIFREIKKEAKKDKKKNALIINKNKFNKIREEIRKKYNNEFKKK